MPHERTPAESTPRTRLLVICLGNEYRGDDAFGLLVARRLGAGPTPVQVVTHDGDGLSLIEAWRGFDHVVFIDAIAAERAPGTILEFDVSDTPAPLELGASSTHALGAGGVIEIARALGELPGRVQVIAVAGSEFTIGAPASPAVTERVEAVVERIQIMARGPE